jgi:hypothetical protein
MQKNVLSALPGSEDENDPHLTTTIYSVRIGDAQIVTVPGELFPEVFYGVEHYRRKDCPQADAGRPSEPAVRTIMTGRYKFIFGLSPDELGYLVPGYDFHGPTFAPDKGLVETADACSASGIPNHYHETNSAGSQLAARWACAAVDLLTGKASPSPACASNGSKTPRR